MSDVILGVEVFDADVIIPYKETDSASKRQPRQESFVDTTLQEVTPSSVHEDNTHVIRSMILDD